MNTLELLDKKEQLKQRAEEIVSKAEKETRRLNEGEHAEFNSITVELEDICLLYTSPSPRDRG